METTERSESQDVEAEPVAFLDAPLAPAPAPYAPASSSPLSPTEVSKMITERLADGSYECMVCCETVARKDKLWSCRKCWGVFHLNCIYFWARNHQDAFRCPHCQELTPKEAVVHVCYCGAKEDMLPDMSLVPGSCGEVCNRTRADSQCPHRCTLLCHPGSCPPCPHTRLQDCYCGKMEDRVGCSSGCNGFSCEEVCDKALKCGVHRCTAVCHEGECTPCAVVAIAKCHCGKNMKEVACGSNPTYACREVCGQLLPCGEHRCKKLCHDGPCGHCPRSVEVVTSCPCGQTPLWKLHYDNKDLPTRASCLDAIPSCGAVCGQLLPCGEHSCKRICHDSDCGECFEMTPMACRCKKTKPVLHPCFVARVPQEEWQAMADAHNIQPRQLPKQGYPLLCERKCTHMKPCGKHKCMDLCCDVSPADHICTVICHKRAPCGIHECGQLCHKGLCPPCSEGLSFSPLYCACGRTVLDPPVPCNTPPPLCPHPCSVGRECGHAPQHTCHPTTAPCPPCVVAVPKRCLSHGTPSDWHRPCSQDYVCGKTCCQLQEGGRPCNRTCHAGPCAGAEKPKPKKVSLTSRK